MKISVAIPTYNRAELITPTLDSIFAQNIRADEVVVVDDGSTDNTQAVIEAYPEPITYKRIDNSGPALARRAAVELCSGDWIALCDSDDIWRPKHIENFRECLAHFPDVKTYFCNFSILESDEPQKFSTAPEGWWDRTVARQVNDCCLLNDDAYVSMLGFQPLFPSAMCFRRDFYFELGGIVEDLGRINSEDAHLSRRLIAHGPVACRFVSSVEIRKHEGNYSADFVKNLEGRLDILQRLCDRREVPERFIEPTKAEIERSKVELFNQHYWFGEYSKAVDILEDVGKGRLTLVEKIKYAKCLLLK